MDRYDPNQWTKEFVVGNKDFCIRAIKGTNNQVINLLKQGEHKAVIAGIDRILNGLVTMINAGYDYRSQVCFFSWIEANIMLFGNLQDAPEQNRLNTAKGALLDARDFAKSENAKNSISEIIDDINNGYNLSMLANKYGGDFPDFEIETLTNLNDKLEISSTSTPIASANATKAKKKPWWLIALIIILTLVAIVRLMTQENAVKSPALENTVQSIESTTQITTTEAAIETTTEITTETTTEATTDANEAILNNIVGKWVYSEIAEGILNPDGEMTPAYRNEAYYHFYDNGRYGVGDAYYEEASEDGQAYAENIDGRYWICIGGGGQEGSYTISANKITFVTDDNVQYGPSTTTSLTFTLDGDSLILEHNYGTTVYKRN